jgi:hypothetical protein
MALFSLWTICKLGYNWTKKQRKSDCWSCKQPSVFVKKTKRIEKSMLTDLSAGLAKHLWMS